MGQIIISGVERRRRWSAAQKQAIVSAAFAPGAVVSEVARQADINTGLLYRWRRDLRGESPEFAKVVVSPAPAGPDSYGSVIEVMAGAGGQARIPLSAPPDLAAAVVKALVRG